MVHELKTWPGAFQAVWEDRKLYDIRKADRPFSVGDALFLFEWDQVGGYTGRIVIAHVTYLTHGGEWGIPRDLCVMGIRIIAKQAGRDPKSLESQLPPPAK
jgi:hypothetical protein